VNHLFAAGKQPEILQMSNPPQPKPGEGKKKNKGNMGQAPLTRFAYQWSDDLPVQACAMVHAGSTLLVAGPPNFVDEDEAARSMDDPKIQARLIDQAAAFQGRKGAVLAAVSAADGKGLASYRLASMPVFDGMAAAGGRLYLATTDGKVLCLGAGEGKPLESAPDMGVKTRPPDADKPLASKP
jgi:outer membrane protein assembly factor BamB